MPSPALILAHLADQVSADAGMWQSARSAQTTERFTLHSCSTHTTYTVYGFVAGSKHRIFPLHMAGLGTSTSIMEPNT
jgi:hypothetical protein